MSEIKSYLVLPSYKLSLEVDAGTMTSEVSEFIVSVTNDAEETTSVTVAVSKDYHFNHTSGLWYLPSCFGLIAGKIYSVTVQPVGGEQSDAHEVIASSQHVRETGLRQAIYDFLLTKDLNVRGISVRMHGDIWGRPRTLTGVNAVEGIAVSVGCVYMTSEDSLSHGYATSEIVLPFRVMVKGMNEDDGDLASNVAGRIRRKLSECHLENYGIVAWRWSGRAPRVSHDVKSVILDFEMRTSYEEDEDHLCP